MRILLIDDSTTTRAMQRAILQRHGYEQVVEAGDGPEGLRRLRECKPDLLLVDWDLPTMDGVTFVRTCREQGLRTRIVIMITEAAARQVIHAIDAGVNNYLHKPFTPDQLMRRVAETMSDAAA